MANGNQTLEKSDVSWHDIFLAQLRLVPNVTRACDVAGIARATAYEHRASFPNFGSAWDHALDEAVERLEYEMHRRAYEGTDKPLLYEGQVVHTVKEFSDTLAIFLAKAHRPDKYRERSEVKIDGELKITLNYTAE